MNKLNKELAKVLFPSHNKAKDKAIIDAVLQLQQAKQDLLLERLTIRHRLRSRDKAIGALKMLLRAALKASKRGHSRSAQQTKAA